ncbi:hypothetical protein [Actinoplanes sp. NPDC020271]|uniref:hypothetical protein n=1 Tax=Actinoplanes sp. NPDC020271 TaxID=3363896 RepID=UPI003791D19D
MRSRPADRRRWPAHPAGHHSAPRNRDTTHPEQLPEPPHGQARGAIPTDDFDGPGRDPFQHRRLRDLGSGRQAPETAGWNDPPEPEQAVSAAAARWNAPVFAAYVTDYCARIHGATAGTSARSGHLADPTELNCGMRHRPPVAE